MDHSLRGDSGRVRRGTQPLRQRGNAGQRLLHLFQSGQHLVNFVGFFVCPVCEFFFLEKSNDAIRFCFFLSNFGFILSKFSIDLIYIK